MILITGTVRLPEAALGQAQAAMARMIEASRAEPGCISYNYSVDVLDRGLIHVNEAWADRATLTRHFATPHLGEWRAQWALLGITDRKLRLYETDEGEAL